MAIEIIIREDGTMTGNGTPQTSPDSTPRGVKEEQGKPKGKQTNVNALLIDYGKQILSEGLNVALDYSGNNILQDRISTAASVAADVLMIAKGGWVGVAAVAMKYATSALNAGIQYDRDRYRVEQIRQQSGMIAEYGGRYTNE